MQICLSFKSNTIGYMAAACHFLKIRSWLQKQVIILKFHIVYASHSLYVLLCILRFANIYDV